MLFKPWLMYAVIAWQTLPPVPMEEQKTIVLQFEDFTECLSIANQVEAQVKGAAAPFRIKQLACIACEELYEKVRCLPPPPQSRRKSS